MRTRIWMAITMTVAACLAVPVAVTATPAGNAAPTNIRVLPPTVAEAQPVGTTVGRIVVRDRDRRDTHTIRLVRGKGSRDNASFQVVGDTLATAAVLDHEARRVLKIRLRATDEAGHRVVRRLTVRVTDRDDPPTAVDDAATVQEDSGATTIDVLANETDVDEVGPRFIERFSQPDHGTVAFVGRATALSYTPDPDYCTTGADTDDFSYSIVYGGSTAEVRVTVECVADAPVAVDDVRSGIEDLPLVIPATGPESPVSNDIDADGDGLTVTAVSNPDGGSVAMSGGDITFTPWPDRCGSDAGGFDYTVSDGHGGTDIGRVRLALTCTDDGPQAVSDTATVAEDSTATTIPVLANDVANGVVLSIASLTQPPHGDATILPANAGVAYTPDPDFCGSDGFGYSLAGGGPAAVTVTVTCVSDPPELTVSGVARTAVEDGPAVAFDPDVVLTDPDAEGEIQSVSVDVVDAEAGDLLGLGGSHPGITGVWDGGSSTLTLTGPASPAAFTAALRAVTFATTTADLGSGSEDRTLQLIVIDDGSHARIVDQPVAVTPVNDAPEITAPATASVDENDQLVVTDVFVADPDLGSGSITIDLSVEHGVLSLDGDTDDDVSMTGTRSAVNAALHALEYEPDAEFDGADTLSIEADDNGNSGTGGARTDSATVAITVEGENDAPAPANRTFSGIGNTALVVDDPTDAAPDPTGLQKTVAGDLLAGANDPDDENVSVEAEEDLVTAQGGLVTIEADGDFTYLPPRGCGAASDSFPYTVTDDRAGDPQTGTATVTINLAGCVWYVDAGASAPASALRGTSIAPYQDLGELDDVADADGPDDWIYLAAGDYTAPDSFPLEDRQHLYTERSGLTVGADELLAADPYRDRTELAGGLKVAADNTVQGLDFGNATSASVQGLDVGTFVLNTETSGTIDNPVGGAVVISNGDVDVELAEVSSSGSPDAIYLRDVSGSLTVTSGLLQNALLRVIDSPVDLTLGATLALGSGTLTVSGSPAGVKDFNGPVAGAAVSLGSNTGATIRFDGGLNLASGASPAFTATGGGTIAVTGAGSTLTSTTGTALTVAGVTIHADDLTFQRISSSGAVNGIRLSDTGNAGGLRVTGSGGACSAADAVCSGGVIASSSGPGVLASNVGGGISIDRMRIADGGDDGIRATNVADLALGTSVVEDNGDGSQEHGVELVGPTGSVAVASSDLLDNQASNLFLTKGNGTVSVDVSDSSFTGAVLNDGLGVTGSGTAVIDVDLDGVRFADNHDRGLAVAASSGSPVVDLTMHGGSAVDDTTGGIGPQVGIYPDSTSTVKVLLDGVDLRNAAHDALVMIPSGSSQLHATVRGAQIDDATDYGIAAMAADNASSRVKIANAMVTDYGDTGVYLGFAGGASAGMLDYTVTGTTLTSSPSDPPYAGLVIQAGDDLADDVAVCADIGGIANLANTVWAGGHDLEGRDIVVTASPASFLFLPGWTGGSLSSYLAGRNTGPIDVLDQRASATTLSGACNAPLLP